MSRTHPFDRPTADEVREQNIAYDVAMAPARQMLDQMVNAMVGPIYQQIMSGMACRETTVIRTKADGSVDVIPHSEFFLKDP